MLTMNLRAVCESKGVTLSELQRKTGLTFTMLRRYWREDVDSYKRHASGEIFKFLSLYHGVTISELFVYIPDNPATVTTTEPPS